jgi:membrane-bound lytic murein transglycosylase D
MILAFLILAFAAGLLFDGMIYSGTLFAVFQDRTYSDEGLKRAEEFEPESSFTLLVRTGNRSFFQSVGDLSICGRREVRRHIYLYLTRDREYLKAAIARSGMYLPVINAIFRENRDLPRDLALLPLLESGFDPHAVSRSRALGLWQFIGGTSAILGLKADAWIDERRDVEKSTRAAILHLRMLYRHYGNWELALAAYNGGSGYITRAMEKTGRRGFWELLESGALRRETAEYVPRFAALLFIYHNLDLVNLDGEIHDGHSFATTELPVPSSVGMDDISRLSGTPLATLRKLNPELSTIQPPPYARLYTLRVPEAKASHPSPGSARPAGDISTWDRIGGPSALDILLTLDSHSPRL